MYWKSIDNPVRKQYFSLVSFKCSVVKLAMEFQLKVKNVWVWLNTDFSLLKMTLHCKCFDHKNYWFWPCPKSGHNVTIVSMTFWKKNRKINFKNPGQRFFFSGQKKIFFVGHASLKLWWNDHKNLGGIMPGFGFLT